MYRIILYITINLDRNVSNIDKTYNDCTIILISLAKSLKKLYYISDQTLTRYLNTFFLKNPIYKVAVVILKIKFYIFKFPN